MTDKPQQLPFDLGHREAYGRADFWVSASNREAVAWLDKWPEWPAPALVLYGPPACGKTHLLQVWKGEAGACDLRVDELTSAPADALLGAASAVMIDDADGVASDAAREEALLHVYNILQGRGGHMLLTAEKPVRDWGLTLPDLKSRLMAAPAVQVLPPDDELIAVVLTKLFSDRQIFVSQEVVQYIVPRVERSFFAISCLVEQVDRAAMAAKRPVTVPLVREILS